MTHQVTGLRAWLLQRLSALYLAGYTLWATVYFLRYPIADYAAWQALWQGPVMGTGAVLLFLALLVHAWVGVRDVILDSVCRRSANWPRPFCTSIRPTRRFPSIPPPTTPWAASPPIALAV